MNLTRVEWQTASPLWEEALKDRNGQTRFKQPALLRFDKDSFMEDLEQVLNNDVYQLKNLVTRCETWENETAGWLTEDELAGETSSLKLYQPAHSRFYLVTASLICRKPGLPDKCINLDKEEKVSFVLRRLVDENGKEVEYGWNSSRGWQKIEPGCATTDEEEKLPMFAMNFNNRDRQRNLLAGFIPVASRETYQAPAKLNPLFLSQEDREELLTPDDPFANPPLSRFKNTIQVALLGLKERAAISGTNALTLEEARNVLLFTCLDFAEFLQECLPLVWQAVKDSSEVGLNVEQRDLYRWLHESGFSNGENWDDALLCVAEENTKEKILSGESEDPAAEVAIFKDLTLTRIKSIVNDNDLIEEGYLEDLVTAALGDYEVTEEQEQEQEELETPRNEPGVFYVARCIYERPRCEGIQLPVVSEPSQRFQLASYFEPEAPTRPIRITMPKDTSIAGLRKFKKNVSVLLSKKLRNQMERVKGVKMEDVDNGDIPGEPGFDLGMICSLSIPIITICALIFLMIILQLLNIIFWWLPFFKICFPIITKKK